MKNLLIVVLLALSLFGCASFKGTDGILRGTEVATTVANLEPMFDKTTETVSANWASFSDDERLILESSYQRIISVKDRIKGHVEQKEADEIIIDLANVNLLYEDVKFAYQQARDVVFGKIHTFSPMDQQMLAEVNRRVKDLDASIAELQAEAGERDVTNKVKEILDTAVRIIRVYRMAKDPLGFTYADRQPQ